MKRLLSKARGIKTRRTNLMAEAGQLVAELHRRGMSWRLIGEKIDVPWATARNWALPYLESGEDTAD